MNGLTFAFAALGEPSGEPFREAFRSKPKTDFDGAIADGQSVVKLRGIGEIAHTELVEPFLRARPALAANQHIDFEFLRVHPGIITLRRERFARAG